MTKETPRRALVIITAALAAFAGFGVGWPVGRAGSTCLGEPITISGTEGPDHLVGTDGPDVIDGQGGDDVIEGVGGDDLVCGSAGADYLDGGVGFDGCDGGAGEDRITACEALGTTP